MGLGNFMGAASDGRPLPFGEARLGLLRLRLAPLSLEQALRLRASLWPRRQILSALLSGSWPSGVAPSELGGMIRAFCEAILPPGEAPPDLDALADDPAALVAFVRTSEHFYFAAHDWGRILTDLFALDPETGEQMERSWLMEDQEEGDDEGDARSPGEATQDACVATWLRGGPSVYEQLRMRVEAWMDLQESLARLDRMAARRVGSGRERLGHIGAGREPDGDVFYTDIRGLRRWAGLSRAPANFEWSIQQDDAEGAPDA